MVAHEKKIHRPRLGCSTVTALILTLGLVPVFGAGCQSQDGRASSTSTALIGDSCAVSGDGTGPMTITYSPDGHASLVLVEQKEKDGSLTTLLTFDLDQARRLSLQLTNRDGTIDG